MQNIWFPAPVFLFFRRLLNVVSTLSISQQYLLQQKSVEGTSNSPNPNFWGIPAFRTVDWLSWAHSPRFSLASHAEDHPFESPGRPPARPPTGNRQAPSPRSHPPDQIHSLLDNPVLLDPIRKPRYPIVLCHGLYGFDVRGPALFRTHYWANVLNVLRQKVGADVIVTGVPGTGSIASRSESLDRLLQNRAAGRAVNFMAHSMGGLDCRHLISHIKPTDYTPVSLTTIGTPHRGSPFMDWCSNNLGLGKVSQPESAAAVQALSTQLQASSSRDQMTSATNPASSLSISSLPSSFTTLLLSLFDSPAYANLSTTYLNSVFNPSTPDDPKVKYFSIAGRISSMNVWHPLWLPKMVLDGFEEKEEEKGRLLTPTLPEHERWGNDGLVTVQSARWGEFLGILEECDHWSLRGAKGVEIGVDLPSMSVPGLSSSSKSEDGDGWNLGDWGRFVRAWKKEEKAAKGAGMAVSDGRASPEKSFTVREETSNAGLGKDFADDVVRASTDKLSAVFDWIIDQVPSLPSSSSTATPSSFGGLSSAQHSPEVLPKSEKSDLSSKADLERFYIALCRKLYDEGL